MDGRWPQHRVVCDRMILPDYEIHELCSKHAMVVPFDPELLNPASLDVLLGLNDDEAEGEEEEPATESKE